MVFPYEILNAVQSKCFPIAFETDDNLVVSAPTGSGKTAIMELAICRLLMQSKNTDFKVVYQAPTKSLCGERFRDWSKKFKMLGLDCAELTGDTSNDHLRQVQQASIIITTPEKWDSITRKWRDNMRLVQMIKLFLVDEVHILKDQRGATLEAVVSRMKSIGSAVRFVALSATVPNSEDIAAWLGKSPDSPHLAAHREVFDESFRPVRLEKHVYGFQYGSNDFGFDNLLRKQVPEIITKHSSKKATMVFCMTRKSAVQTAQVLASVFNESPRHFAPWPSPSNGIAVGDRDLRGTVQAGVAFHHGGLSADDRHAVEQGFLQGNITIICSTSTLAVGVNLPCYLVILQGTTTWANSAVQSYSDLEVMQMLGRAGRPQFETSACAAILTREQHVSRYQKMVSGQELLESTLHLNLIEHLNAEISLGTISDMKSAHKWLSSTFLRIRVARNPSHYQLKESTNPADTDELMHQWCEKDVQALLQANMIEKHGRMRCTDLGEAMAKYYINFETMKIFAAIPPKAKISEVLTALCQAAEFTDMRLRSGEKSYYKELNKKLEIMFPVNVDIALPEHKASIIIQAELGGGSLPDGENYRKHHQQHSTDRAVIFGHANRLIRCIIDCQICMKDAVSVRNALELGRSIAAKAWDSTPRQLKQLPDIGDVLCRKLASHGINSIEKLLTKEAHQIELALGKTQPFGARLIGKLESFPRLHVSVKEMGRRIKMGHGVTLEVKSEIGFLNKKPPTVFNRTPVYVCFVAEDSNGALLDFRRFAAKKLEPSEQVCFTAFTDRPITHIRCRVMCDEIVGTATYADLSVSGISATIFPRASQSKQLTVSEGNANVAGPSMNPSVFDDDGIDDGDLLAATVTNALEAVDDIDDLPPVANAHSKQTKSKSNQPKSVDARPVEIWKEPTQLPNGRWTCQHICKDKGIECKHKCCQEGVVKPKRKPSTISNEAVQSDPKQRKITGMNVVRSKSIVSKDLDADKENHEPDAIEQIMVPLRKLKEPRKESRPTAASISKYREPAPKSESDISRKLPGESELRGHDRLRGHSREIAHQNLSIENDESIFGLDDDTFGDWDEIYDPADCDWNVQDVSNAPIHQSATRYGASTAADKPNTHVSLRDVQLYPDQTPFMTDRSTSPHKQTQEPNDHQHSTTLDKEHNDSDENLHLDNDGGLPPWPPSDPAVEDGLAISGKRTSSAATLIVTNFEHVETAEQRQHRLYEEDQKRRWEGLPEGMWEEFHKYVEIVD